MKKLFFLSIACMAMMAVSCDKSKDCKCTTTQQWEGSMEEPAVTTTTQHIDKGECSDMNATQTMNAGGDTYTATIDCVEM